MKYTKMEEMNLNSFSSDISVSKSYKKDILKSEEKYIFKKYKNFFNKKPFILDVGCGTGRTTVNLVKLGYNVEAMDYSEEMIKEANKMHPKIKFKVMDACNLKYNKEKFDMVFFSFNGLDCINPDKKRMLAIKEANRVLKKGGLFIFSSHNKYWLPFFYPKRWWFPLNWGGIKRIIPNFTDFLFLRKYRREKHKFGNLYLRYISIKEQKQQLKKYGFKLIETVSPHKNLLRKFDPYIHYIAIKKS